MLKKQLKPGRWLHLAILVSSLLISSCAKEGLEKPENIPLDSELSDSLNETINGSFTHIRIAALKGPTAMGMVELMEQNELGNTQNTYSFDILGTADEIPAMLVKNELDMAAVPCNLASVLFNKTEGGVKVLAINTLGVLYILDTSGSIQSIGDLEGKKVYSVGQGTTPEFALNYVLNQNGLIPGENVFIEYKSESTELAALLQNGEGEIAMLPEPYVTTVLNQNSDVHVALSITEEWDKVQPNFSLLTGVVIVREEFLSENPEAVTLFLNEYKNSIAYVQSNLPEAAELIANYDIVPNAAIAEKALPGCNIVYIDGNEMVDKIDGYLNVLYEADPASIGGQVPDSAFYYLP